MLHERVKMLLFFVRLFVFHLFWVFFNGWVHKQVHFAGSVVYPRQHKNHLELWSFFLNVVFFCHHEKLPHLQVWATFHFPFSFGTIALCFSSLSASRQTALGCAKIHKCFRKSLKDRPIPRGINGLMLRFYRYVIWWLNFQCGWSDSNEYRQQVGSPEGGGTWLTGTVAQTGVWAAPTYGQLAADDQSGVLFWTNNHNNIKPH